MKGLKILYVAAWRIFAHMGIAFKISAPWLGMACVCLAVFVFGFPMMGPAMTFIGIVLSFATLLGALSCIAIGWHRYSLLAEFPAGWFYRPRKKELKAYFITLFKFCLVFLAFLLIVQIIFFACGLVARLILLMETVPPFFMQIAGTAVTFVSGVLFTGLAIVLPAAALRHDYSLADAYAAAKKNLSTLIVFSIGYSLISFLYDLALDNAEVMKTPGPLDLGLVTMLAFVVISTWFFILFSIGYLSELYRTFVLEEETDAKLEPSL